METLTNSSLKPEDIINAEAPGLKDMATGHSQSPEQTGMPDARRISGAMDAGSMALEHTTEALPGEPSPSKFRRGRRLLARVLTTAETARLSPGAFAEDIKFAANLVTTDPYKQAEANRKSAQTQRPEPNIRQL